MHTLLGYTWTFSRFLRLSGNQTFPLSRTRPCVTFFISFDTFFVPKMCVKMAIYHTFSYHAKCRRIIWHVLCDLRLHIMRSLQYLNLAIIIMIMDKPLLSTWGITSLVHASSLVECSARERVDMPSIAENIQNKYKTDRDRHINFPPSRQARQRWLSSRAGHQWLPTKFKTTIKLFITTPLLCWWYTAFTSKTADTTSCSRLLPFVLHRGNLAFRTLRKHYEFYLEWANLVVCNSDQQPD